MANLSEIAEDLLKTISEATGGFDSAIDPVQREVFKKIELLLKDLDLSGDKLANTIKNIKAIGSLKQQIEKAILNKSYTSSVKDYAEAFYQVSKLQTAYFSELSGKIGSSKLLDAIKQQAVQQVVDGLTDGVAYTVRKGVQDILQTNIRQGGSYNQLVQQMRDFILTNQSGPGALERYSKQITTDSLNQFSRQYSQALTADLSNEWFMYVGSNKATTREFCELLTKKKWIHKSELPEILRGVIDGKQVPINPKTKLWYGAIEGTTVDNFQTNAGGHGCDHQVLPVSASIVPQSVRDRFP